MVDDSNEPIEEIGTLILKETDEKYKLELVKLKLFGLNIQRKSDNNSIIETLKQLIELEPKNESYYINAANRSNKVEDKLGFIDKALEQYPNDYFLYNRKGIILYSEGINSINKNEEKLSQSKMSFNQSLEQFNSLDNEAWINLCKIIEFENKNQKEILKDELNKLYDKFQNKDYHNVNYLVFQSKYEKILEVKNLEKILKESYDFYKKADNITSAENVLILLLNHLYANDKKVEAEKEIREYEELYKPSKDYIQNKADLYTNEYDDKIEDAAKLYANCDITIDTISKLIILYKILNKKELADELLQKYDYDTNIKLTYCSAFNEYQRYCQLVEENWLDIGLDPDLNVVISYLFAKIKLRDVDKKGYSLAKKYYDDPDRFSGEIAINYYILSKIRDQNIKIKDKIESKIMNNKDIYSDEVLAAGYALIDDEPNAINYINKAIKHNNLLRISMLEWPAFDKLKNNSKYKKVMKAD